MPLLKLNELENVTPLLSGKIGNAFCRVLMRMLAIDKVNDLYDRNSDRRGPDFAGAVLKDIGVEYEILNQEVLQRIPDGPFITISNHPYGHIDGVMLVDLFGHLRPDFKVMVNKFLGRIEALEDNFICVTPTIGEPTAPTKDNIQGIKDAVGHIRGGNALGLFPAGAISDLSLKDGCIRDREWQEPVIRLIKKLNVPIVPVHFLDRNSFFYYSLGLIHWKMRLLRLPSEVFNKRENIQRIAIGEIITPQEQADFSDIRQFRDFLRNKVYNQF
jgi:putative hemolysin